MSRSFATAPRRPRATNLFQPKLVHSTSPVPDATTVVDNPLAWTEHDTLRLQRARGLVVNRLWERIATVAILLASFLAIAVMFAE